MVALTDYRRVSHRQGLSADDMSSSDIEEYIEDAQAIIEGETERTYAETDSRYGLARAACTDLAAAYCLIRLLGGKYSGLEFNEEEIDLGPQQNTKVQLIGKLLASASRAIAVLSREESMLLPRSTTP